jgi:hypothetical protein
MGEFETVISAVNAGIGSLGQASGFLDQVFGCIARIREQQLSAEGILRAYYLEVLDNLEILAVFDLARLGREKPNSEAMRFVMSNLRTEIGAAILLSEGVDEQSRLYRFLRDQGRIRNPKRLMLRTEGGREMPVTGASFYENILQAVSFTVVKTEALRRIAGFSDAQLALCRDIRIEKRLTNIAERSRMIKEKLEDLPGLREMAR